MRSGLVAELYEQSLSRAPDEQELQKPEQFLSAMGGGRYSLIEAYEGDARVRAEPFEAIEIPLSALWAMTG
ncbi:MAG: hypothetical protein L6Q76_11315 [Polyangiaceae bacterium]|nr:hypothetical protein [Polyangiaceae bacterium]